MLAEDGKNTDTIRDALIMSIDDKSTKVRNKMPLVSCLIYAQRPLKRSRR